MPGDALAAGSSPLARPLLRGWSHLLGFGAALVGTAVLVGHLSNSSAVVLGLIYGASLAALLGFSALYHCVTWSLPARTFLKPFDHAAIFLLIAGSATPFTLAMPGAWGKAMLIVAWVTAALGVSRAFFWPEAPKKLIAAQCVITGWLIASFLPMIGSALDRQTVELIFLGGVLYSVGAAIFATRRPNPWPRVFGFHEIFHLLVVAAAAAHYAAVWRFLVV